MAEKEKKVREPKAGDKVKLVLASGKLVDAEIDKVGKSGLVDLTATMSDKTEIQITGSPRDDAGKLSDCWCFPEAPPEA